MKNWLEILAGIIWKINHETKEISLNEKVNKCSIYKINQMLDKRIKIALKGEIKNGKILV